LEKLLFFHAAKGSVFAKATPDKHLMAPEGQLMA
jgi:hypothetical protein